MPHLSGCVLDKVERSEQVAGGVTAAGTTAGSARQARAVPATASIVGAADIANRFGKITIPLGVLALLAARIVWLVRKRNSSTHS